MRPEGLAGQVGLGAMIITTLLMYAVGIGMGCFIIWKVRIPPIRLQTVDLRVGILRNWLFSVLKVFKAYKDRVNAGTWRHAPITATDGEAPLRVGLLESGIRRGQMTPRKLSWSSVSGTSVIQMIMDTRIQVLIGVLLVSVTRIFRCCNGTALSML